MPLVSLSSVGSHVLLELDRPPVNAINRELAEAIHAALDELECGGVARPFVFTARNRTFSAGLDLREIPTYSPDEQREFIQLCNRTAARLYRWPAPVVGALNGHAMAAGFVLALTPDYRIAVDEGARFGIPEVKAGIPFPAVPLTIMTAELPAGVVRRLALTCSDLNPDEARRDGVVDELVTADRLRERALEVLTELAQLPRETYARVKRQIRGRTVDEIERILTTAGDPLVDSWLSRETATAAAKVLET